MRFERLASERIQHFTKFDHPIANIVRVIIRDIKGGSPGTPYDQLDPQDVDERRILEAFANVPMQDCCFHWRELPGPGFNRRVLVVVIARGSEPHIVNVGYLPRQHSGLL